MKLNHVAYLRGCDQKRKAFGNKKNAINYLYPGIFSPSDEYQVYLTLYGPNSFVHRFSGHNLR